LNVEGIVRTLLMLWFTVGLLASASAVAAGDPACRDLPWSFGMTPQEVAGVTECGPYRSFSNGDLETYKGVFDGRERNFQFFFAKGKLRRIGIYTYEGTDPHAGGLAFLDLYRSVAKMFGAVETKGYAAPTLGDAKSEAAFVESVEALLGQSDKVQMGPRTQPTDAVVFASFARYPVGNESNYIVVLYFDARP
jgi:hypothetical protein